MYPFGSIALLVARYMHMEIPTHIVPITTVRVPISPEGRRASIEAEVRIRQFTQSLGDDRKQARGRR